MSFVKIFEQIYDSSIAEDWQTRVVFQDMLVLADKNGIVDRTPEAIARRTNIPLEMVRAAIPKLEAPDMSSRTPDHDGRRIVRLDEHRDWGWRIVNFQKYRESATKEMLRMGDAERKRAYRARVGNRPSLRPPTKRKEAEEEGEADMSTDVSGTCKGQSPPPTFQEWENYCESIGYTDIRHRKTKYHAAATMNWEKAANWEEYAKLSMQYWLQDNTPRIQFSRPGTCNL